MQILSINKYLFRNYLKPIQTFRLTGGLEFMCYVKCLKVGLSPSKKINFLQ